MRRRTPSRATQMSALRSQCRSSPRECGGHARTGARSSGPDGLRVLWLPPRAHRADALRGSRTAAAKWRMKSRADMTAAPTVPTYVQCSWPPGAHAETAHCRCSPAPPPVARPAGARTHLVAVARVADSLASQHRDVTAPCVCTDQAPTKTPRRACDALSEGCELRAAYCTLSSEARVFCRPSARRLPRDCLVFFRAFRPTLSVQIAHRLWAIDPTATGAARELSGGGHCFTHNTGRTSQSGEANRRVGMPRL
jgi:hypothetical protein